MIGKTAFIAGGAGGIGAAICSRLAEEQCRVICADIVEDRANALAARLTASGRQCEGVRLDAADPASWNQALESTRQFGGIDVLVTAIYSGVNGNVDDLSSDDWDEAFRVTTSGVFMGMKAARPHLRTGGSIINLASTAAHDGAGTAAYAAAKSAVLSLTRSAAVTYAASGIRVNAVTPGAIQTPALDRTFGDMTGGGDRKLEAVRAGFARRIPLGHIGDPNDIANAVLFLASDEAAYVTGAELIVDGGLLAR